MLTVSGSGFAPNSRVKIFAKIDTSGRDIPAQTTSSASREVEIGTAPTDSAGNFTAQLQIPSSSSDFFKDIWKVLTTLPDHGSIKVKIDDLAFQGRYTNVPEIENGVTEDITYAPLASVSTIV